MKQLFTFVIGLLLLSSPAMADQWNKKTYLTVSEAFYIPGADYRHDMDHLEAGTYVFKVARTAGSRHIVNIYDEREAHLVATVIGVASYQLEPTGNSTFEFERDESGCLFLKRWFYPGNSFGLEFAD
jgi:hypothetical protein